METFCVSFSSFGEFLKQNLFFRDIDLAEPMGGLSRVTYMH